MALLIHAILRVATALITDHCFAIASHLRVTPHQTLPSLRTVELYIPLRRLCMTSVTVLRFALSSQFPTLGRLCFAISCGTMPTQPLFLTVLDRHALAALRVEWSFPALPCPRNARLYHYNAKSCQAIPLQRDTVLCRRIASPYEPLPVLCASIHSSILLFQC